MKSKQEHHSIIRREFIELSAGIICGLGIPGLFDNGIANADESNQRTALHWMIPVCRWGRSEGIAPRVGSMLTWVPPFYWENEENQQRWKNQWNVNSNPNGYWVAFGHLFKVLYSYNRLVRHIADKDKVRLRSHILLERYFNPDVQGG